MHPVMTLMPWNSAPAAALCRVGARSTAPGPRRRATRRNLLATVPKFVAVETSMLGTQFDPTLGLSLSRQRHADLIAEAHQQQLAQEALGYAPRRTQPPEQAARGRVASRRTGRVLASLWRTMSFAVRGL